METVCRICKNDKLNLFHKGVRDNEDIDVLQCPKCGLLQLSTFSHITDTFYEEEKMHQEQYNVFSDETREQTWEDWILETASDDERRFSQLEKLCRGKSILDFGCGNGGFLRRIKKVAKNVAGIELDKGARQQLAKENIAVYQELSQSEQKWDVITMFQVIEHLVEPEVYLGKIYSSLNEGGIFIVETPNAEDALISLYESEAFRNFTFWSVHVMLYNSQNLETLLHRNGFLTVDNGQIQRYPLSNHLYWLSKKKPGGHEKWTIFQNDSLNTSYEAILKEQKLCDTLFGVFQKKEKET